MGFKGSLECEFRSDFSSNNIQHNIFLQQEQLIINIISFLFIHTNRSFPYCLCLLCARDLFNFVFKVNWIKRKKEIKIICIWTSRCCLVHADRCRFHEVVIIMIINYIRRRLFSWVVFFMRKFCDFRNTHETLLCFDCSSFRIWVGSGEMRPGFCWLESLLD